MTVGSACRAARPAVVWPPEGADPIVLVVMSRRGEPDAEFDDALIAQATEVVISPLQGRT